MRNYDVVIVGGGLVGLGLSLALAHSGLRIAVVNAQAFAQHVPTDERSLVLSAASRAILEGVEVWPQLAQWACPLQKIHISAQQRFAAARLSAQEAQVEAFGWTVNFGRLLQVLQSAVMQAPAIECLCPAKVIDVQQTDAQAQVIVEQNGQQQTLRSQLVVAADGANSTVRRIVGINTQKKEYDQLAIVTHFDLEYAHENTAYERFTQHGVLAVLPHQGKRVGAVWALPTAAAQALLALDDKDFQKQWVKYFGERLGPMQQVYPRQHYPLRRQQAEKLFERRVVLIGNAAQALHPVGAQGFNLGLRDAACLAQLLIEAHPHPSKNAEKQLPLATLLPHYQQWREPDRQDMLRFTDCLAKLHQPLMPVWLFGGLQDAGLLALDVFSPLKQLLIRHGMGLRHHLPKLACRISLTGTTEHVTSF